MSNKAERLTSITVSELIGSLRPGQLWILVVIVFGLLSGSFGFGYKACSLVSETEAARLKKCENDFRGLQAKHQFLELYQYCPVKSRIMTTVYVNHGYQKCL